MKFETEFNRLKKEIKELFIKNNLEILDVFIDDFSIRFSIEQENIVYNIYWSFFIDKFRPKEINFSNATYGSGIVFKEVNVILNKVTDININTEDTVSRYPNFNNNLDIFFASDVPVIANGYLQEGNFVSIMKLIMGNIKEYHFLFFERVSSLQVVNDEIIDKVPKEEYGNYITGRFMNVKVLIIMKLCANPRYEEYKNWAIGAYKKGVESNPDRYKEDYKIVLATIEYLDGVKYRELL